MGKVVIGVLAGILLFGLVRFVATPWPEAPHFHANWAVFANGERLDLSADRYMEEVEACVAGEDILPTQRVHMHANDDDVIHVHHDGVTWGHILINLGFELGDDFLLAPTGERYQEAEGRTLKFIVNGFQVGEIENRLIESGDRLLVSYGAESPDEIRESQLPRVATNAEEFNERQDPAGCAGSTEITVWERLRRAFWG